MTRIRCNCPEGTCLGTSPDHVCWEKCNRAFQEQHWAQFQKLQGEWADKIFLHSTLDSICSHFREESIEFAGGIFSDVDVRTEEIFYTEQSPSHSPEEAADCLLLLLCHAHKAGYSLFEEALKKMKINHKREWDITDEKGVGHSKHLEEKENCGKE
ncbi:hypothetical protein KAR91_02595 [Candidatus Pacearchaeota archaeon]|nr:hypothetical protein [Candidatus Pacearchaeota archaeon]